jgi:hypothetical protein
LPFGGASFQAATSGRLDLDDAGDAIVLGDLAGRVIARVVYGAEANTGASRTRDPDGDGDFADHTTVAAALYSPGTHSDGRRFAGCPDEPVEPDAIEIWSIQGSGPSTLIEGQTVYTADNIVIGLARNGFFIQTPEERSDGDPETSDGIFVFTNSAPAVQVGDLVDVYGDVDEFFDWTELTNPRITVTASGVPLPDPVVFDATLPSPDQPQSPNELERFENMLVEVRGGTVTSTSDQFGNFLVVAGPERAFREPGLRYPGEQGLLVWDGNPEIFEVDPNAAPGMPDLSPAAGARIVHMRGPLAYRFCRYRVYPTALEIEGGFAARPVRDRQEGELTIATQNLFGLVDDIDDPGVEDEVVTPAEVARRLSKHAHAIREVLKLPDVLCVQEVEKGSLLDSLADGLSDDAEGVAYTAYAARGTDPGGRNLGLLVRETIAVDSVATIGGTATFDFDGSPEPTFCRPPLVLCGSFTGGTEPFPLVVICVHLRSLLGIDDASEGPFVRAKRLAQAQFLADEVERLQSEDPDVQLVIAGDFNAFEFTDGYVDVLGLITGEYDPASALIAGDDVVDPPLRNRILDLEPRERYSTVFEGSAQAVDHVLTSSALAPFTSGVELGRGNADAPRSFAADGESPLHASDHDGLVVFFRPGGSGPQFIRGDANASGRIDLSDGVFIFNFLFLGGEAPPCRAAADTNGSGRLDLTSGIYLLNFLFQGGPPPPPPSPQCGPFALAADEQVGCERFAPCT